MKIDEKYRDILLEALEERMYQVSLQLEQLKGQQLTQERKRLTQKQKLLEELQHHISSQIA